MSSEHRINLYTLYSRFGRGCALARMGQEEQAISEIRAGIEDARRSNLGYMHGFMLGWLAAVQMQTGDPETALVHHRRRADAINDVSGRAWEAELRRLRAEALLAVRPDAAAEAERGYNEAIAVAQKPASPLAGTACDHVARTAAAGPGEGTEAVEILAPIYGWFGEGLDTADLRAAKAVLDELDSPRPPQRAVKPSTRPRR